MSRANKARGEASIDVAGRTVVLRPTFQALVAAEEDLGPLFSLVERASAGELKLSEMTTLFHHLAREAEPDLSHLQIGQAVVANGLTSATPALRAILGQILQGS